MDKPQLYRKRIIPEEIILLDKDEILYSDDSHIITRWNTIRPKKILHHGCSCYFLKEGFKVSKFYREDGTLIYWYCDIISYSYDASANSYVFTDLLADVLIYPDGKVEVVDVGEIADALTDMAARYRSGEFTRENLLAAKEFYSFDRQMRTLDELYRRVLDGR